jgi:hypothetical protein
MSTVVATPPTETLTQLAKIANERFAVKQCGSLVKVGNSGREVEKNVASLRDQLQHEDWQQFLRMYVATHPLPVKFASGQDIHEVFENHRPGSCMRYKNLRELREVYADNPDTVRVAYWLKSDHPLLQSDGSCLVWTDESKPKAYVDRIYSSGWLDPVFPKLICQQLAELFTGWETVCIHDRVRDFPRYDGKLSFRLSHPDDRLLPYGDTLNTVVEYDCDSIKLGNFGEGASLDNTAGVRPDGEGNRRCCECGDGIDPDDCYHTDDGEALCYDCGGGCEWCERTVRSEDLQYIEVYQTDRRYPRNGDSASICSCCLSDDFTETESGYCLDSDLIETVEGGEISPPDYENGDFVTLDIGNYAGEVCRCDNAVCIDGEYAYVSDCTAIYNGDYALTDDCVELHNGDYALTDDCTELHNGDYALTDDCVELHNGDYALTDDCVELHSGDYALTDDCVELHNGEFGLLLSTVEAIYPNFVDYNPEIGYLQKCKMQHGETEIDVEVLKGIPFAVGPSQSAYRTGYAIYHLPTGLVAIHCPDRDTAIAKAKRIWSMLYDSERAEVFNSDARSYNNSSFGRRFSSLLGLVQSL